MQFLGSTPARSAGIGHRSVPGDDIPRGEPIVDSHRRNETLLVNIDRKRRSGYREPRSAKIKVVAFGSNGPIAVEREFGTVTDGPASLVAAIALPAIYTGRSERTVIALAHYLAVAERNAAAGVHERAVP